MVKASFNQEPEASLLTLDLQEGGTIFPSLERDKYSFVVRLHRAIDNSVHGRTILLIAEHYN